MNRSSKYRCKIKSKAMYRHLPMSWLEQAPSGALGTYGTQQIRTKSKSFKIVDRLNRSYYSSRIDILGISLDVHFSDEHKLVVHLDAPRPTGGEEAPKLLTMTGQVTGARPTDPPMGTTFPARKKNNKQVM